MSWSFYKTGHAAAVKKKLEQFNPYYDLEQANAAKELVLNELAAIPDRMGVKVDCSGSISGSWRSLSIKIDCMEFVVHEPSDGEKAESST